MVVVVMLPSTLRMLCQQYMTQIREKQAERETGAWQGLPSAQRVEAENGYRHMSMLARFHNIMGNETIHALEMMTTEIRTIFTNAMMVDRIAAMLNYFLLHLVSVSSLLLNVVSCLYKVQRRCR